MTPIKELQRSFQTRTKSLLTERPQEITRGHTLPMQWKWACCFEHARARFTSWDMFVNTVISSLMKNGLSWLDRTEALSWRLRRARDRFGLSWLAWLCCRYWNMLRVTKVWRLQAILALIKVHRESYVRQVTYGFVQPRVGAFRIFNRKIAPCFM